MILDRYDTVAALTMLEDGKIESYLFTPYAVNEMLRLGVALQVGKWIHPTYYGKRYLRDKLLDKDGDPIHVD